MITNLDIYRSASVLIREHGEDAGLEFAIRADAILAGQWLSGETGARTHAAMLHCPLKVSVICSRISISDCSRAAELAAAETK